MTAEVDDGGSQLDQVMRHSIDGHRRDVLKLEVVAIGSSPDLALDGRRLLSERKPLRVFGIRSDEEDDPPGYCGCANTDTSHHVSGRCRRNVELFRPASKFTEQRWGGV
jgi:hypothetical protein